jgi:hypothetical protein
MHIEHNRGCDEPVPYDVTGSRDVVCITLWYETKFAPLWEHLRRTANNCETLYIIGTKTEEMVLISTGWVGLTSTCYLFIC